MSKELHGIRFSRSHIPRPSDRRFLAGCLIAYLLLGVALYGRTLHSFFVSDDFDMLAKLCERGPLPFWISPGSMWYRPLPVTSLWLDGAVSGMRPVIYHVTNTVIHSLSAFAVTLVALALARVSDDLRGSGRALSVLAGLLFLTLATHPETVSWVSARPDLMAALFSLLSIYAFLVHLLRGSRVALGASLLSYVLGLLSKESAVAVFPVIVILGLWLARDRRTGLRLVVPHVVVSLCYVAVRRALLGTAVGGYGMGTHLRFDAEVIGKLLAYFPSRTMIPALGTFDVAGVTVPVNTVVLGTAVLAVIAAAIAVRRVKLTRAAFLMAAVGVASLLPVANLSVSAWTSEGTRFLYLPSALFVIALVVALDGVLRRRALVAVCVALIALSAWGAWSLNENWRKAGRLSRAVVEDICRDSGNGRMVIVNVPDSIDGAYVLRNGSGAAAALFSEKRTTDSVLPMCSHPVLGADESFPVAAEADGWYLVRLPEGRKAALYQHYRGAESDHPLEQCRLGSKGIYVHPMPADDREGTAYFRYSSGRLVEFQTAAHHSSGRQSGSGQSVW